MARGRVTPTMSVEDLEMALVGYKMKQQELEQRIREIRGQVDGRTQARGSRPKTPAASAPADGGKRTLSASARKRIALAQKKRWAEHRKKQLPPAKTE